MKFEMLLPHSETWFDCTKHVGDISVSDNIDSLGAHLKFTAVFNLIDERMQGPYQGNINIALGTKVRFTDNDGYLLFLGMITNVEYEMPYKFVCDAYDYAYNLNKSSINIQFNNIDATTAIKQVCAKQEIKLGHVCSIPTKIRKIYHSNLVVDVINDILKQAELERGTKCRMEMRGDQLYIDRYVNLVTELVPVPVNNADRSLGGARPLSFKNTANMDDVRTRVTVISGTDRHGVMGAAAINREYEKVYGVIGEVIVVDGKNRSEMLNVLKTKLAERALIKNTTILNLFGDRRVRSGHIIKIDPILDYTLSGEFLVKSCVHTYKNSIYHTMELEVEPAYNIEAGD